MIVGALAWAQHVVTDPDDMEPTMVTRHTAEGAARRQNLADASSLEPTDPPPYPPTEDASEPNDTSEGETSRFPWVPPTFSGTI